MAPTSLLKPVVSRFLFGATFALAFTASNLLHGATTGKKLPFHGKLEAVDTSAQTITLAGKTARVFHVESTTKITDGAGNPSSLGSATVGEDVGGSYVKETDGTMNLFSVRFGAKPGAKAAAATESAPVTPAPATATPPPAAAPTPAPITSAMPVAVPAAEGKKQRFSGKVVSVDAAGNTLVVHGKADQTITVTSATKLTGVATLAEITAGEKVSGSCVKTADGAALTAATLKVAK